MSDDETPPTPEQRAALRTALETKVREGFRKYWIPDALHEGLAGYILDGIPTGSFLEAVIDNDLGEACSRADDTNRRYIFEIVTWMYNVCPTNIWGREGSHMRHVKAMRKAREADRKDKA
jgi:hypothetical protein